MKPRQIAVGVVLCGLAGLVYLAAQPLKRSGQFSVCSSNFKQISNAMLQYTRDYDEHFPKSDNWAHALKPYLTSRVADPEATFQNLFHCPTSGSYYVYNGNLAGVSYVRINSAATPWVFEVGAGQNRIDFSDDGRLWPQNSVHQTLKQSGSNVLFGDGQTRLVTAKPRFMKFAPMPIPKAKPQRQKKP